MQTPDTSTWLLMATGMAVMAMIVLRAIGQGAVTLASDMVDTRRAEMVRRQAENANAEAVGRAASLEPLALNADGTIEEPIIGVVENP